MSPRAPWWNGKQAFFDPAQLYETIFPMAPLYFEDDFLGKVLTTGATNVWRTRTVGTPGAAALAAIAGGACRIPLAATAAAETNNIDWNDIVRIQNNLATIIEF